MHCGVMVTGYNQGDWERLLAEDYSRPPAVSDAANMDDTLALGELVEHEEYLKRQTADVGVAEAGLAARRATQPIGTPDEIIEKIRTLQHALSLEMVVIHMFYGGMPRAKAEKSLRLFAEKVLPEVQAMPTPINPASLGRP